MSWVKAKIACNGFTVEAMIMISLSDASTDFDGSRYVGQF